MKTVLVNFEIPLQLFSMTQTVQFLYAANGNFSSNSLQKIKDDFNQKSPGRNQSANGTKTDKQNTNGVN